MTYCNKRKPSAPKLTSALVLQSNIFVSTFYPKVSIIMQVFWDADVEE